MEEFTTMVVEASNSKLVVVDFFAVWWVEPSNLAGRFRYDCEFFNTNVRQSGGVASHTQRFRTLFNTKTFPSS
jgi:hypothetical protein